MKNFKIFVIFICFFLSIPSTNAQKLSLSEKNYLNVRNSVYTDIVFQSIEPIEEESEISYCINFSFAENKILGRIFFSGKNKGKHDALLEICYECNGGSKGFITYQDENLLVEGQLEIKKFEYSSRLDYNLQATFSANDKKEKVYMKLDSFSFE